ncbi:hypothetical protein NM688_g3003 [Phlebia brevispora]|uniref:Uncharacterized protein n=1 Tax=Phlebia brevispora TaxID=194682 RepID=A0ACC1T750_9APHY|nr:hypothetical protein NM688_g3003 [Phlebia brevispora]
MSYTIRPAPQASDAELDKVTDLLIEAFGRDFIASLVGGNKSLAEPYVRAQLTAAKAGGDLLFAEHEEAGVVGVATHFGPGTDLFTTEEQRNAGWNELISQFEPEHRQWWENYWPKYDGLCESFYGPGVKLGSYHTQCLAVAPKHQRKGIGASLMAWAADKAKAAGVPSIVETSGEPDITIYKALGYSISGTANIPQITGKNFEMVFMSKHAEKHENQVGAVLDLASVKDEFLPFLGTSFLVISLLLDLHLQVVHSPSAIENMEEDDSQDRFTALVSGTVAESIGSGLLLQRQKHDVLSARPTSPVLLRQSQQTHLAAEDGSPQNDSNVHRLDPVRRFRANHMQRTMKTNPSAIGSHIPAIQADSRRDDQPHMWQYEQHIPAETSAGASSGPHFRSGDLAPSGIPMMTRTSGPKLVSRAALKPSKSLRQRFDAPADDELASSDPAPSDVSNIPAYSAIKAQDDHSPMFTRGLKQNFQARGHSRSASVVSSAFGRPGGPEEDISSIMMRGASDLRNAKFEIEEQRREIDSLQSQLVALRNEKEEVLQRLKSVKETAKRGLESNSRSLEGMRTALDALKTQSEESFAFTLQAKASLPSVDDLRITVDDTMKIIEPLLNDEGHFYKTEETRQLISDLQLEHSKSQQVVDILRDRLQSVGGDLIDAKSRITELEGSQAADREALRSSSVSLCNASEQIENLAQDLKKQQGELNDALIAAADLELKVVAATEQQKDEELQILSRVNEQNVELKSRVDACNARIQALEGVEESFSSCTATLNERASEISALETLSEKETELKNSYTEIQDVKQAVGVIEAREQALLNELARVKTETEVLQNKLREVEKLLEEAREEIAIRTENLHQADTNYKVLEERFEDQSVTLRLTKEEHGDMQERLIESEAKFAVSGLDPSAYTTYSEKGFQRDLEAATGKLECQIAVLTEQKTVLQAKINDLEDVARQQDQAMASMKAEYDARLCEQEDTLHRQLAAVTERANDTQKALEEVRAVLTASEAQLLSKKEAMTTLQEQLREAKSPSTAHQEAVDTLNAQIMALRSENASLTSRARDIDERYKAGDLNEEEKTFINTLICTSQAIHEQALVEKGNELRRRDNTIRQHEARIKMLENTLAKHLEAQAQANAVSGTETRSLIDPSAWVRSSDTHSSPPNLPEEDVPSTNIDNTVSAKPTPAPPRGPARPPLAPVPVPAPNIMLRTPGPARPLRATGAGVKGTPRPALPKNSPVPLQKPPHAHAHAPDRSSPLVPPRTPASKRERGYVAVFARAAVDEEVGPQLF